jgi:hypothetical protein
MLRVRYTADGGHYRVSGYGFDPGDEHEVDRELASYLSDRDDFVVILEKEEGRADQTDDEAVADAETEAESEDSEGFDVDAFVDRTPVDDVADDIRAGEADGHLDELAEAAGRVTVSDAIGERRAELETEG